MAALAFNAFNEPFTIATLQEHAPRTAKRRREAEPNGWKQRIQEGWCQNPPNGTYILQIQPAWIRNWWTGAEESHAADEILIGDLAVNRQ